MAVGDNGLTWFRNLCLSLPETSEAGSWGHPNFRAGKRTFAAFEWIGGRPSMAFYLGPDQAGAYLLHQELFFPTPYGRGRWISMWADKNVNWMLVRDLAVRAYRAVALKRMIAALEETTTWTMEMGNGEEKITGPE